MNAKKMLVIAASVCGMSVANVHAKEWSADVRTSGYNGIAVVVNCNDDTPKFGIFLHGYKCKVIIQNNTGVPLKEATVKSNYSYPGGSYGTTPQSESKTFTWNYSYNGQHIIDAGGEEELGDIIILEGTESSISARVSGVKLGAQ